MCIVLFTFSNYYKTLTKTPKKRYILRTPPGSNEVVAEPVVGGVILQGNWDGSTNVLPTLGRLSDAIKAGYIWNVAGSTTSLLGPDGGIIPDGMMILALVDTPGALASDKTKWKILSGVV